MEFIGCYSFSKLVPYADLLVMLWSVLGRCNNMHYIGLLTVVLWFGIRWLVWCGPSSHSIVWVETVIRGSDQCILSVMFVLLCRCLGLAVVVGWDHPFFVQEWTFPFGGTYEWIFVCMEEAEWLLLTECVVIWVDSMCRGAHSGVQYLVETLCYKPEGHWFNSRWLHWNFSLT
jgi:hypothetical protein